MLKLKIFRRKKNVQLMIEHDLCVFCESEFERRFHQNLVQRRIQLRVF